MTKKKPDNENETLELVDAAIETMVGDIMDIVERISMVSGSIRSETIKIGVTQAVADAIRTIAARDRKSMIGTLVKCTVKDGLKWELTTRTDELDFLDALAVNDAVNVVVIEYESTFEYGAADTEQRDLDLPDFSEVDPPKEG